MAAIIVANSDEAAFAEILTEGIGMNRVFDSWQDADIWLESNAEVGVAYRVFDCDD